MGQGHDAGDIVFLGAMLLLAKVADPMASLGIVDGQDVKEKGLHIIIERLVVQEQLDQQTEILTIDLVGLSVHLEDGEAVLAVNLRAGGTAPGALAQVMLQHGPRLGVV